MVVEVMAVAMINKSMFSLLLKTNDRNDSINVCGNDWYNNNYDENEYYPIITIIVDIVIIGFSVPEWLLFMKMQLNWQDEIVMINIYDL